MQPPKRIASSAVRSQEEHAMKVAAYHSSNPSDPDVYHDHDDCPTGQQIPARNRVAGRARTSR